MAKFENNGVELNYVDQGYGDPLILLHGVTSSHLMYEEEINLLKDHFRILALDSRGHGESDKPKSYTLDDHIEDVLTLMDTLNIEQANILGTSMGSYIAQGVAIKAPHRVNKLILVVSKSHGKVSSLARLFSEHESELEGMTSSEKINHLGPYIFHQVEKVNSAMDILEEKNVTLTPEQEEAATAALGGFDFREDLSKITAETLIISGKYDGLNPPEEGEEIYSKISNGTFLVFESSGHSPSIEEPERFKAEIQKFLKDH